ncbi:MAG: hypothetical protein DME20_06500 [Verrucomicrobia bacterium]|nr:MAG: hypothetical protein DME20_06500 [Verrucomicrobiota bacterium]
MLVRLDHVARFIVNANHSIVRAAAKLRVVNCVADRVWLAIPQPTNGNLSEIRSTPRSSGIACIPNEQRR